MQQLRPFTSASVLFFAFTLASASACALVGCTTTTTTSPASAAAPSTPAESSDDGDAGDNGGNTSDEDAAPPPSACAPGLPTKKSGCKIDSSWVRGIAHFDPTHLKPGSKPVLRAVLRHGFTIVKGEDAIGGRLHAWESYPVADPSKGEIPFAVDMCGLGTAMWSEENGAFHLVLILDEDGNNDVDKATSNEDGIVVGTPGPNELVKMVDVDVSCNAKAACLDVKLDCIGPSCTKIEELTSCKKKTPGCKSDSEFCR